jgi:hypothetical protein
MSDNEGHRCRAKSRRISDFVGRRLAAGVALLTAALMAGCATNGPPSASMTVARGASIAFDSIDGLPESQFHKLVRLLSEEAESRQLAVVTREIPAQYRVRGYASAHLRGKRTVIAWVWDVYDADRQRALRISGEELASGSQRGWAAADDQVLRRIAQESLAQLAGFLASPGGESPALPPGRTAPGMVVASTEVDPARIALGYAAWRPSLASRSAE